jgi:hypothetical protein
MTLTTAFIPLVAAVLLGLALGTLHQRLRPVTAARVLAATLAVVLAAALPSLWLVSIGYLSHTPVLGNGLRWCSVVLGVHADVPPVVGVPAVLLTLLGVVRAGRVMRAHVHLRCTGAHAVTLIAADELFAYTLPGCAGRVVVSTGLLDMLDDREQRVVLAHERAHGSHRHDRYMLFGRVAEVLLPPLRPLTRRLNFALERWADEAAVRAVGGDRDLVALTIARVAVGTPNGSPALAFAGLGATGRVKALLDDMPPPTAPIAVVWCGIAATAIVAGYQVHHLALFVTALCH